MTSEDEEKDAYKDPGRSDSGHRRDRFPRKNMTRPGCSCSGCSPCQIHNAMESPGLGPADPRSWIRRITSVTYVRPNTKMSCQMVRGPAGHQGYL